MPSEVRTWHSSGVTKGKVRGRDPVAMRNRRLSILSTVPSGAVTEIQELLEGQAQPLHKYALANALDVADQRKTAVRHYKKLAGDNHTPEYIRLNANLRLTIPYRAPETITRSNGLTLLTCHG